jgi:trehalose-phosphatase
VLIQVATSTQEDIELASTVADIVTRIDATHSTLTHNPLVFLRQDISFNQYLAMMSIADALVVTSLREGMNLTCHEFICCQDGLSGKKHGPVILSEFTGSSEIFSGSELAVNPWDYAGIAKAFKIALEMTDEEKERRYNHMRTQVLHHTGEYWMRNLSEHLNKVFEEQFRRDTMSIPRLSAQALIKDYEASWTRLFILDYEGTLASYGAVKKTVITNTDKVTNVLVELANDDKNVVYVMSGRPKAELELLFDRVSCIGLIAENGCFLREPGAKEWMQFPDKEKTAKWMEAITQILQYYLERVEGSWIEERQCSIVFHYESANEKDAATASRQAGECANHINDASERQSVRAIPTRDSVIIEPSNFDKATAAQHILDKYPPSARPEFLFVAGNDRDDETVFKWAKNMKDDWIIRNVQTVTVGDRNSLAMSTLPNGTTGMLHLFSMPHHDTY